MATNTILQVDQDNVNILTDSEYAADASITDGVANGTTASSELYNKTTKQVSLCSAGLSQFTADNQDTDIDDTLTVNEYATCVQNAIDARVVENIDITIVTQPQFDNSTKAATTEFVNRALGSYTYSEVVTVDDDLILDETAVGKVFISSQSPERTLYVQLPDYDVVIDGEPMRLGSQINVITNRSFGSTKGIRMAPSDGQNLFDSYGTAIPYVDLFEGSNVIVTLCVRESLKYWSITGGTRQLQDAYEFKNYASTNGYQYQPGGLIIQWGVATVPTDSSADVYFPTPFRTSPFSINATMNMDAAVVGNVVPYVALYGGSNLTVKFKIRLDTSQGEPTTPQQVFWQAIGK